MLTARFHSSIAELPAASWDALRARPNPFVSHAFLHALERTGCIRPEWGWQAHHLGLYEGGELVAAAPLYLKGNSRGEFVFDWSWASAWERAGGSYYPKLLNAVPYSPVPGPRLLAGSGARAPSLRRALVGAMKEATERWELSSAHANFLDEEEGHAFGDDWLARSDVQFHWHNRGYRDFADFLDTLKAKKRKNIRQERAQVHASGLAIQMTRGNELDARAWRQVHALYAATFDAKGNHAALTPAFFRALGELGDAVQVATACEDGEIVAMALFLQGDDTLYGRYWGARRELPGLHFELCYYCGIEHAIARGLQRFEPGAQGEHKLARGFLPVRTHSRHYLAHPQFRQAV
ncbi:MAG TPA: GNAT family N-acetyltransferase, partial [Ktedonobacterales bacterium]|nr:GNAT family N-acetyltransferase [Ktedonobacterales bacterium]